MVAGLYFGNLCSIRFEIAGTEVEFRGELMSFDIRSPFYVSCGAAALALVLLFTAWNRPEIKRITL